MSTTALSLFQRARAVFRSQPLLANSVTGFLTFTGCDAAIQMYEDRTRGPDLMRSLKMGAFGVFLNGLCLHVWYRLLDRVFTASRSRRAVVAKCIADQLVYAPVSISMYLGYSSALKADTFDDWKCRAKHNWKSSFRTIWLTDCTYWPFVNAVAFGAVPLYFRPTFVSGAQILWQLFMAKMGHKNAGVLAGIDGRGTSKTAGATATATTTEASASTDSNSAMVA